MILEHCSRASCVQIIEALRDRVAELTAVLEERDDMILSQAEGLATVTKERDELREALEMVCKIECVDDLWKAQDALAKLGADKKGEGG